MDSLANRFKTIKALVCAPLTASKNKDSNVSLKTVGMTPPVPQTPSRFASTSHEKSLIRALRRQKEYLMSEVYTWASHDDIKERARIIYAQGTCESYEDALAKAVQESLQRTSGKCARMQGQYKDVDIPLEENDIVTMASTADWRMQLMENRLKKEKCKGHDDYLVFTPTATPKEKIPEEMILSSKTLENENDNSENVGGACEANEPATKNNDSTDQWVDINDGVDELANQTAALKVKSRPRSKSLSSTNLMRSMEDPTLELVSPRAAGARVVNRRRRSSAGATTGRQQLLNAVHTT